MIFMTFGQVNLPEKVDLIVSEVVGNVATGEGVVDTIRDARRRFLRSDLLKDPEAMIPRRCQTAIAPVTGCHVQPTVNRWWFTMWFHTSCLPPVTKSVMEI